MDYSKINIPDASNPNFLPIEEPCGQHLELYFSARKLKDMDWVGKSDPQVRFHIKNSPTASTWTLVGKTETIDNNLNPDFKTTIETFYQFEVSQSVRIEVVDMDGKDNYEQIGFVDTQLANLVSAKDHTFTADIYKSGDKKSRGQVVIRVVPMKKTDHEVHFKIACTNLPMITSCLCMSSIMPYIAIDKSFKAQGKDNFVTIAKTEVSENQSPHPVYKPMKFKAQQLCNSNFDQIVQFKIFNKNEEGTPATLLGTVRQSMNFFVDGKPAPVLNAEGQPTGGVLKLEQFKIIEKPTFLEYLQSGWGISLQLAIDYTGSNGDYSQPDSLHYLGGYNQYEHAIRNVGSILECYDSDKSFPVYGFGGVPRFMGANHVSHCFPLNGKLDNPEIVGTEGIINEYKQKLQFIGLHGPTLFAPILKQIITNVQSRIQYEVYNIFLILTDGEIHDMDETKSLIIDASALPLSIIIIGVGMEKFKMMKELDSDGQALRDTSGRAAQRDIVQFVKFKKYSNAGAHVLAEKVLKEVPDQLVSYMQMKGI